jgi:hypothetical protein
MVELKNNPLSVRPRASAISDLGIPAQAVNRQNNRKIDLSRR